MHPVGTFIFGALSCAMFLLIVSADHHEPQQVQAAPVTIPTQLDLGGNSWKVDIVPVTDAGVGFVGYTACDTRHIQILSKADDKRTTLLHEVLHAYVCQDMKAGFLPNNLYYNSKTQLGHEGFPHITKVVMDALERNPQLAAYLTEGAK